MESTNIINLIKSGERSRLIPVVADMSKEERAVSPVLAVFSTVPSFANSMLAEVGAPTNMRAKVKCFSQVVFKDETISKKLRPDGLIVVDSGRKIWSALVEAKIGNAELSTDQIEAYLDLARTLGINAIITMSNQFASVPTHHPISVNRQKLRSVELYHFSWLSLLTKATLISNSKKVDDPEQAYLVRELIRYLSHPSSGVCAMTKLGPTWKDVCTRIQTGTPLSKSDPAISSVVLDWHQLSRFLALDLSAAVGKPVELKLPRAHIQDPQKRLVSDISTLCTDNSLQFELDIPNVVSTITIAADFLRRNISYSITLTTPQDKSRPTAAINWVTRQLSAMAESTNTLLRAHWPGRSPDTVATIADAIRDPKTIAPDSKTELPSSVDIKRVLDIAGRFKGPSTFIEEIRRETPRFYKEIVQNVSNWIPKPPQLREKTKVTAVAEDDLDEVIGDGLASRDSVVQLEQPQSIASESFPDNPEEGTGSPGTLSETMIEPSEPTTMAPITPDDETDNIALPPR